VEGGLDIDGPDNDGPIVVTETPEPAPFLSNNQELTVGIFC